MTQTAAGEIAYTPDSINQQLLLGTKREELAEIFEHKNYRTLDVFMRRKGYTWDRDNQIYVLKGIKPKGDIEKTPATKRLEQALKLINEGKDPKEVARQLGFKSHLALANYMKEKGYLWDKQEQTYKQQTGEISDNTAMRTQTAMPAELSQQDEMLQMLIKNRDKLAEIINGNGSESLPRYSLPGVRIAKTIHISNRLNELVKQFSEEKNINQRELIELAIIETMRKYGYEAEIKGLLG